MFYDLNLPRWQLPLLFETVLRGQSHCIATAAYPIDTKKPLEDWPRIKVYFHGDPGFLSDECLEHSKKHFEETGLLTVYELAGFSKPPKGAQDQKLSVSFLWIDDPVIPATELKPGKLMLTGQILNIKNIKSLFLIEIQASIEVASDGSEYLYKRQRLSFTATPEIIAGIQHVERAASLKELTLADFQADKPYRFLIRGPHFYENAKGYFECRGTMVNVFHVAESPFYENLNVTKSWYQLYDGNPIKIVHENPMPIKQVAGFRQSLVDLETPEP